jgi:cobalamin biosynthetic protein CobC
MADRPVHGGRLNAAARHWGIPREQWLDLSTGINPWGWPVPEVPPEIWRRLPEDDDGLEAIIRNWAQAPAQAACLTVPGSQAAIQALPRLRRPGRVGVPAPGYREHAHCWAAAGHEVVALSPEALEAQLEYLDVVVWIQPNNPTGARLSVSRLLKWHSRLARRGGWLVLDEAFIVGPDDDSLAAFVGQAGLIVLRSLGKFFGLAGIRAGAGLAWPGLGTALDQALGPWALSGPTRYVMAAALQDIPWQTTMVERLRTHSRRLQTLLAEHSLAPQGGTLLFQYVCHPEARTIAAHLARQGVLVRHFSDPAALRFGLPGGEDEWQKLQCALERL